VAGVLRRYTDVLSLLDIMRHNRLTLLSPSQWYDQNDTIGLNQYGARQGDGSVYALCFAEGYEQAHHWQLFAGHSHGLCIQFDRDEFIAFLNRVKRRVLHGPVIYQNLSEVRARKPIKLEELPFLKRDTFRAEAEYRIVTWQQEVLAGVTFTIPMPASLIKRVTLGPAVPRTLAETLKDIACEQKGCANIPFGISRLVNNASWAEAIAEGISEK
jgi:hypothetical protein